MGIMLTGINREVESHLSNLERLEDMLYDYLNTKVEEADKRQDKANLEDKNEKKWYNYFWDGAKTVFPVLKVFDWIF